MDRRSLLSLFVNSMGVAMAGIMTVPVVLHSLTPILKRREAHDWRPLGPYQNYPIDKIVSVNVKISNELGSLNYKAVYVWRKHNENFVVYSRACTDLGCPLNFDPGSEWFFCPCHGGIFDKEGNRQAGPPQKPMWRYESRINNEILEIDLKSVPSMV